MLDGASFKAEYNAGIPLLALLLVNEQTIFIMVDILFVKFFFLILRFFYPIFLFHLKASLDFFSSMLFLDIKNYIRISKTVMTMFNKYSFQVFFLIKLRVTDIFFKASIQI